MTDRVTKIRDALAQADRHKRLANAAEMARVHIRLGYKPRVERQRTFRVDTTVFTPAETTALYEALGLVKRDHLDRAAEYEKEAADAQHPDNRRAVRPWGGPRLHMDRRRRRY